MTDRHQIAIDIDGVLGDSAALITSKAATWSINLAVNDLTTYRLEDNSRIEPSQARRLLAWFNTEGIQILPALPGVKESLQQLSAISDVDIVTSRPVESRALTVSWLRRQGVPFRKIVFGTASKSEVVDEYDFIVDDNIATCRAFAARGKLSFLVDFPWNRLAISPQEARLIHRVSGLRSATRPIEEIIRLLREPALQHYRSGAVEPIWRRSQSYLGDRRGQAICASETALEGILRFVLRPRLDRHALDLCCGIGVASVTLLRLGMTVDCVDCSPEKVAYCQGNMVMAKPNGHFQCTVGRAEQYIRTLNRPIDVAHIDPDWGSAGHLTDVNRLSMTQPSASELVPLLAKKCRRVLLRVPAHMSIDDIRSLRGSAFLCSDSQTSEQFVYAIFGDYEIQTPNWSADGWTLQLIS